MRLKTCFVCFWFSLLAFLIARKLISKIMRTLQNSNGDLDLPYNEIIRSLPILANKKKTVSVATIDRLSFTMALLILAY